MTMAPLRSGLLNLLKAKEIPTSGRKNMPPARMRAHANWRAIGIWYAEALSLFLVPLLTMAAMRSPMVIAH